MENITFKQLRNLSEDKARDLLESIRWPDNAICAHCGSTETHKLQPKTEGKTHVRPGVYFCGTCRKQFTVTVGTIFEGSRIKIEDWSMAVYLMCSSKKGISAHQLHRTIGVTYKTAWSMAHRIRFAMTQEPLAELIKGKVEVDETYIGGNENPVKIPLDFKEAVAALLKVKPKPKEDKDKAEEKKEEKPSKQAGHSFY